MCEVMAHRSDNGSVQMAPLIGGHKGANTRANFFHTNHDHANSGMNGRNHPGAKYETRTPKHIEARIRGRETWSKKTDFLLSIIGFAVDLANVWRFPFLCYRNGGGAFLIPYFLMLIFGAIPLFFMELALGQFHREGSISIWKVAPLFKGIGLAECLISFYVSIYYNVIIAWALYYLVASFSHTLPWTRCDGQWNTEACFSTANVTTARNNSRMSVSLNSNEQSHNGSSSPAVSSAAEYFERGVLNLHRSGGVGNLGVPHWPLVLCLAVVFLMLYFSMWKGVKSSGKVVWVTATMPYLVLTVLLVRGVLLPGAGEGIRYFLTPCVDRLGDPQVWIDAAVQIFYSVGAGFGTHIAYASYNTFSNNCYRDCIITVIVNSATSIFSGVVIFSYLGFMAYTQNVPINNVAAEGPGLVFVVYPEAIAVLPGSVGWAIIFFIMLMTLGLDSAMGGLEAVLTAVKDQFSGTVNQYIYGREILTGIVCMCSFLIALQNVTYGGMYMVAIWDRFSAGTAILCAVFFQAIAIGWFYGLDQFCDDIYQMLGFRPGFYWRLCWKFISPIFLFVIIVSSIASFHPLSYDSYTFGRYDYPRWTYAFGWLIATSSMIAIPLVAVYQILTTHGSLSQKIALNISPQWEHRAIKEGGSVKRFQALHWLTF